MPRYNGQMSFVKYAYSKRPDILHSITEPISRKQDSSFGKSGIITEIALILGSLR